jgi:hypothetical protein
MKDEIQSITEESITLQSLYKVLKKTIARVTVLESQSVKHDRTLRDMEEEYPLLPPEADDISAAVKRKGAEKLGGKKSNAYQDRELRSRVYRDIYTEIKRQYGLIDDNGRQKSYKKLKRKYVNGAIAVVEGYELPVYLQNEVDGLNELEDMEE